MCLDKGQKFESQYTPIPSPSEDPHARGKPSPREASPCPCYCDCPKKTTCVHICVGGLEIPDVWAILTDAIEGAVDWLGRAVQCLCEVCVPDLVVGGYGGLEADGGLARIHGEYSPGFSQWVQGQSQGLGMNANLDADLGLMKPQQATSSISFLGGQGPVVFQAPEHPDAGVTLKVATDEPSEFGLRGAEPTPMFDRDDEGMWGDAELHRALSVPLSVEPAWGAVLY